MIKGDSGQQEDGLEKCQTYSPEGRHGEVNLEVMVEVLGNGNSLRWEICYMFDNIFHPCRFR
jgi:hypothetical protein